jgi:hypothetical protein
MKHELNIAPRNEIIENHKHLFKVVRSKMDMNMNNPFSVALPALTSAGNATSGHRKYRNPYPDTTVIDILRENYHKTPSIAKYIRKDMNKEFRGIRVMNLELLKIYADKIKLEDSYLYNKETRKINLLNFHTRDHAYGSNFFSPDQNTLETKEDIEAYIKGFVLGGAVMDSDNWRARADKFLLDEFEVTHLTGQGMCHIGHLDAIREQSEHTYKSFSERKWDRREFEGLESKGLISFNNEIHKGRRYDSNEFALFIRTEDGLGCCDDLSIIIGSAQYLHKGINYAKNVAIGISAADHMDTGDKVQAFPVTGGADEMIANELEQEFKRLTGKELLTLEEKMTIIIGGMKNSPLPLIGGQSGLTEDLNTVISDSITNFTSFQESQRRYLITPLQSHIKYLGINEKTRGLKFGYEKIRSEDLYKIADRRIELLENIGLIKQYNTKMH